MTDSEKWILITRCITGEASAEEQKQLTRWLSERSENREFYDDICSAWNEAKPKEREDLKSLGAYYKLRKRIEAAAVPQMLVVPDTHVPVERKLVAWPRMLRIAASFVLLLSLTGLLYLIVPNAFEPEPVAWESVYNPAGKRSRIQLPDSSIVWLNAESTLSYPAVFQKTKREVKLSGEAFFEVTRNKAAPFHVTAGSIRTTVLGTSFNIHAFDNEADATVTVVTGKVSVTEVLRQENRGESNVLGVLTANKKIVFSKTARHAELTTLEDTYHDIAWKDGVLAFHDLTFGEIAERLEHWYGVTIRFEHDMLRECPLEGTFSDLPLDQVLKLLKMTANFNYSIHGKEVMISGKSCTE